MHASLAAPGVHPSLPYCCPDASQAAFWSATDGSQLRQCAPSLQVSQEPLGPHCVPCLHVDSSQDAPELEDASELLELASDVDESLDADDDDPPELAEDALELLEAWALVAEALELTVDAAAPPVPPSPPCPSELLLEQATIPTTNPTSAIRLIGRRYRKKKHPP